MRLDLTILEHFGKIKEVEVLISRLLKAIIWLKQYKDDFTKKDL